MSTRAVAARLSLAAAEFSWSGEVTGTPNGDTPSILNASYNFKAEVEVPEARELGLGVAQAGDGMIVTQGSRFGGYGFYVLNRKPVFLYNFVELRRVRWEGADPLTPGKHTLEFDFKYTIPLIMQWDENFDIGADTGTPVAKAYQVSFKFTGKLNKLTLKIDR